MCNRFTMTYSGEVLRQYLGLDEIDEALGIPRYNVAPSQTIPVLRKQPSGKLELVGMKWGLVPKWATADSHASVGFLNARSETVGEKPAFRDAANRRRCAIPADGYIEWTTIGKKKQPHWFRWHGGQPFLFAALWEPGTPETAAILTREANADTREFHDRMPVILLKERLNDWLDETRDWDSARTLLDVTARGAITQISIHPKINSSKSENREWLTEYRDTLFG